MKKILLFMMVVAGLTAQAAISTFSMSNNQNKFTITRSDTTTREVVFYRTMSMSALATVHFTPASGALEFAVGESKKTVTIEELDITTAPLFCRFQMSDLRYYRFEVIDIGGFRLAYQDKFIDYGNHYRTYGWYISNHIEDLVYIQQLDGDANYASSIQSAMPYRTYYDRVCGQTYIDLIEVDDDSRYETPFTISTDYVFDNMNPDGLAEYHASIGNKLYATIFFEASEIDDGYQYIQILADNETTYDGIDSGDNVNTPSTSIYKACFEVNNRIVDYPRKNCHMFFPHRYDYKSQSAGNQPSTHTEFPMSTTRLHAQKFKNNTYRAENTGALVLDPTVKTLTVRFDAGGSGPDLWMLLNMNARLALCDEVHPQFKTFAVPYERYHRGNPITIVVVYSEIVKSENTMLNTNWGNFTGATNDYANTITFHGTISDDAEIGSQLTIYSLTGTVKDMAGNDASRVRDKTIGGCVLYQSENYPITYDFNYGVPTAANPYSYNYDTATFTLNNPTSSRPGYVFAGWTGSNGNTPQTTVTINKGSHGDLHFVANWVLVDYVVNLPTNLEHGTVTSDKATAHMGEDVTLTVTPENGYGIASVTVINGHLPVAVTAGENGIYTFEMPAADVNVGVEFEAIHILGDLNGDGAVDVTDVNILINLVLENITTAEVMGNPDLDGNNTIDIGDVNAIINIILTDN